MQERVCDSLRKYKIICLSFAVFISAYYWLQAYLIKPAAPADIHAVWIAGKLLFNGLNPYDMQSYATFWFETFGQQLENHAPLY